MPLALTPRLLRRGLELFAVISFLGVVVVLVFFGQDLEAFLGGLPHLHLVWLIVGLARASMDWLGGGTRLNQSIEASARPMMSQTRWRCVRPPRNASRSWPKKTRTTTTPKKEMTANSSRPRRSSRGVRARGMWGRKYRCRVSGARCRGLIQPPRHQTPDTRHLLV